MNILILTGRFGMGHVKCARTLKENILAHNSTARVEVVDLMDYMFPCFSNIIYKIFETLVSRMSGLYNVLNKLAGEHGEMSMKRLWIRKMKKLDHEFFPDIVIANLAVCGQYYSAYLKNSGEKTPLYICVTDVTFHNEWIIEGASGYFVADSSTREALIKGGVSPEIIHITGIPVSHRFSINKKESNPSDSGLSTSRRGILVMGGGLGLIPGGDRTLEILNGSGLPDITLICGKNHKLARQAQRDYPNLQVLGYSDNIPELMKSSKLVITKPGGITTFEAIKARTPLFIVAPTLEQELGNAEFIKRNELGRVIENVDELSADELRAFMENEELLDRIQENMRTLDETYCRGTRKLLDIVNEPCPVGFNFKPKIFLTFDDGPSTKYTPVLLKLLKDYKIPATFFMVGEFAENNPGLVRNILSLGHQVNVHGYRHKSAYIRTEKALYKDTKKCKRLLENLGASPTLYRPPWGHMKTCSKKMAEEMGLRAVTWDVMAEDWRARITPNEIAARILERVHPGAVICLHDGRGRNQAPLRTIEALKIAIPTLLDRGYGFEVYK